MHDDPPPLTPGARRTANRLLEVLERERRLQARRRDGDTARARRHPAPALTDEAPETPRSD